MEGACIGNFESPVSLEKGGGNKDDNKVSMKNLSVCFGLIMTTIM
jgi:hypothetical protein